MMGCTYISIKMALVYKAYDEEFAANGFDPYRDAFKCFDINNDLGALRLDSLRHAYHLSLKNN